MVNVNRYEIRLDNISGTASTISIPFHMDFHNMDNAELQTTEFVDVEVEKAINKIVDYDRYAYYPVMSSSTSVDVIMEINYDISIFNGGYVDMTINDLGITTDEIQNRRQAFTKTMLRLNFYDTDDSITQKLIGREILHLNVDDEYLTGNTYNVSDTIVKPTDQINLKFKSKLPAVFDRKFAEGFKFYHYKTDLPVTLYMKAAILNAKTGGVINLFFTKHSPVPASPSIKLTSGQVIGGKFDTTPVTFFYDSSNIVRNYKYLYNIEYDNMIQISPIPYSATVINLAVFNT